MFKSHVNYAYGGAAYPPGMETMGDRIRTLRESRNLSQDALGAILGVSGPAVSAWESGTTKNLRLEHFLKFCAHFNADPFWVAFGKDADPRKQSGPSNNSGIAR